MLMVSLPLGYISNEPHFFTFTSFIYPGSWGLADWLQLPPQLLLALPGGRGHAGLGNGLQQRVQPHQDCQASPRGSLWWVHSGWMDWAEDLPHVQGKCKKNIYQIGSVCFCVGFYFWMSKTNTQLSLSLKKRHLVNLIAQILAGYAC